MLRQPVSNAGSDPDVLQRRTGGNPNDPHSGRDISTTNIMPPIPTRPMSWSPVAAAPCLPRKTTRSEGDISLIYAVFVVAVLTLGRVDKGFDPFADCGKSKS